MLVPKPRVIHFVNFDVEASQSNHIYSAGGYELLYVVVRIDSLKTCTAVELSVIFGQQCFSS
jgi:hypothetical protein